MMTSSQAFENALNRFKETSNQDKYWKILDSKEYSEYIEECCLNVKDTEHAFKMIDLLKYGNYEYEVKLSKLMVDIIMSNKDYDRIKQNKLLISQKNAVHIYEKYGYFSWLEDLVCQNGYESFDDLKSFLSDDKINVSNCQSLALENFGVLTLFNVIKHFPKFDQKLILERIISKMKSIKDCPLDDMPKEIIDELNQAVDLLQNADTSVLDDEDCNELDSLVKHYQKVLS